MTKAEVAVVAGLFSLLGAYAGAFLARRTEYFKWIRQARSETFAEFLKKLADAQHNATEALYSTTLEPLTRDIKVTEAYAVPENYSRIVKLYLPKHLRGEFTGLVREIGALHASSELGSARLRTVQQKIERIEEIFQHAIDG